MRGFASAASRQRPGEAVTNSQYDASPRRLSRHNVWKVQTVHEDAGIVFIDENGGGVKGQVGGAAAQVIEPPPAEPAMITLGKLRADCRSLPLVSWKSHLKSGPGQNDAALTRADSQNIESN